MESKSFQIDRYNVILKELVWGVHENEDEVHIIPCHRDLDFLAPHVSSQDCPCHPKVSSEGDEYKTVVEHNMIH